MDLLEVGWGALTRLIWLMIDRSENLVNAVLNMWVMAYITVITMERCTLVE